MWLKKLKIAIIEENADALGELLDDIPEFSDEKEIEQAIYLSREAVELLHRLKDETSASMKKLKQHIDFLRSTESKAANRLDIKS